MSAGYRTLHLDDIPTVRFQDEPIPDWKPVRRELGVEAFGTNAYVGQKAGDYVVEPHDELANDGQSDRGHQEIYLVLDGAARFTVDGESFDIVKGGIVFLEDPALRRQAVALQDGTVVFAVGAPVGEAFVPSDWEDDFIERGTHDAG
jgi:hypothetical protein